MSTVSVFVPCYNYGRFLHDSVGSVLSQDGVDVEVLIIDDASTDDSSEVGARLAASDPRVSYVRHARNLGHIATYNEGIDWANGDYLALLSADDMLTSGALKRAADLMDQHPAVGFVYGGVVKFHSSSSAPSVRSPSISRQWRVVDGHKWLRSACLRGNNPIHSPEAVVRTSTQRQVGGYRPDLPHTGDLEMWLRLATVSSVGRLLDSDQAYYRVHNMNMHHSYRNLLADMREVAAAYAAIFADHGEHLADSAGMWKMARRALARRALKLAREALDDGRLDWEGTSVQDIAAYAGQLTGARSLVTLDAGLWWRMRAGPRWVQQARPITYAANYPRAWLTHRLRRFRAC